MSGAFKGRVAGINGLFVDCFAGPHPSNVLGLLTHAHTDHLGGIDSFPGQVYCTETTRLLLLNARELNGEYKYRRELANIIVTIGEFEPTTLTMPGSAETFTVTAYPAHHILGAVMYLIQADKTTVFHTGDFRIEKPMLMQLRTDPTSPFRDPSIIINDLYIDATFCSKNARNFPTRERSIGDLMHALKEHPHDKFKFNLNMYGYEPILRAIFRTFHAKVHVSERWFKCYDGVLFEGEPVQKWMTLVAGSTRFHSCEEGGACKDPQFWFVHTTTQWWVHKNLGNWRDGADPTLVKYKETGRTINSFFSMHASLDELQQFVTIVRPRRVHAFLTTGTSDIDRVFFKTTFEGLERQEAYSPQKASPVQRSASANVAFPSFPTPPKSLPSPQATLSSTSLRRSASDTSSRKSKRSRMRDEPPPPSADVLALFQDAPKTQLDLAAVNVTDMLNTATYKKIAQLSPPLDETAFDPPVLPARQVLSPVPVDSPPSQRRSPPPLHVASVDADENGNLVTKPVVKKASFARSQQQQQHQDASLVVLEEAGFTHHHRSTAAVHKAKSLPLPSLSNDLFSTLTKNPTQAVDWTLLARLTKRVRSEQVTPRQLIARRDKPE